MNIRKALSSDLDSIEAIYDHIHDYEESGAVTIGWIRGIYPIRKTAEDALAREDLFVMEDNNNVVATAIINQIQVPEYHNACWQYPAGDDEIMVLHTLIVDPLYSGRGYGKVFVSFYENFAREHNCPELRMDTNARNTIARRMYLHLGYTEADIVPCVFNGIPDVQLVCLEKHLDQ